MATAKPVSASCRCSRRCRCRLHCWLRSMPIDLLIILGAGGHAKVVYDAVMQAGLAARVEIRDDNPALAGATLLGLPVQSTSDIVAKACVHIAVGRNGPRAEIAKRLEDARCRLTTVIHPRAVLSPHASIGVGSLVAALAVVGPAAALGKCVIINHGSVVDHDCTLGSWVHIAPNATLGGNV